MSTERFDIRHAPAPRESFRLLYISKSKFGGDWNSTTHTHSCTELFYCLSGEGQFYLAGQLFPVKPDDMVIVNPQVEHTELSLNASPLEYIVLGVASMEFLFSKADTNYAIFNCRENRERMVTLLHMLLAEADRSLDGCETVCQDLLEVLLIWVRSSRARSAPRSASGPAFFWAFWSASVCWWAECRFWECWARMQRSSPTRSGIFRSWHWVRRFLSCPTAWRCWCVQRERQKRA